MRNPGIVERDFPMSDRTKTVNTIPSRGPMTTTRYPALSFDNCTKSGAKE
jgi:hypothetical protein